MSAATSESRYRVTGMDCAACANKIDTAVRRFPGVEDVAVSVSAGTLKVSHAEGFDGDRRGAAGAQPRLRRRAGRGPRTGRPSRRPARGDDACACHTHDDLERGRVALVADAQGTADGGLRHRPRRRLCPRPPRARRSSARPSSPRSPSASCRSPGARSRPPARHAVLDRDADDDRRRRRRLHRRRRRRRRPSCSCSSSASCWKASPPAGRGPASRASPTSCRRRRCVEEDGETTRGAGREPRRRRDHPRASRRPHPGRRRDRRGRRARSTRRR